MLYHFGYDSDGANRNLHIVDLFVDPKARKQGIGRGLLMAVAAVGRASGAQEMIWSVYNANELAATFYKSLGAQKITDLFFMRLPSDTL